MFVSLHAPLRGSPLRVTGTGLGEWSRGGAACLQQQVALKKPFCFVRVMPKVTLRSWEPSLGLRLRVGGRGEVLAPYTRRESP